MDKTDRLRDYGLAFLLYEQSLGICGYELIRELFIFIKLILNSYLTFGTGEFFLRIDKLSSHSLHSLLVKLGYALFDFVVFSL